MYREIPAALKAGATDDNVVVTVLTGSGNFYCSGNDMNSYLDWQGVDVTKITQEAALRLQSVHSNCTSIFWGSQTTLSDFFYFMLPGNMSSPS